MNFRPCSLRVLFCLAVLALLQQSARSQNFLASHKYISNQVAAKVFVQRPNTIMSTDSFCINATQAKTWLYLDETILPTDTRLPWYQELRSANIAETCATTDSVMYATSNGPYSSCGTEIYTSFNSTLTGFVRSLIPITNQYWIGSAADHTSYGNYTPLTTKTAPTGTPAVVSNSVVATSASASDTTLKNISIRSLAATTTDMTVYGPLNRCGVWGKDKSHPTGVWQHFNVHFTAPASKQYYIGLGADNYFRLRIDGVLKIDYEGDSEVFKIWHIFPFTLSQGSHIISVEAENTGDVGCFGAEIYNNTAAELAAATSDSQLSILFSSRNTVGLKICAMAN